MKWKKLIRPIAAALVVVIAVTVVSGSSTSTNYELDLQATPGAADDSFSTNFHMVGVSPQDAAGDSRTSPNYEMETVFVPLTFDPVDTTPPVIQSGPTVTFLSDTTALVEWTTDELADGIVDYGLTTAYGSTASQTGSFDTLHQVVITGLTTSTTYNYRVNSTDVYANGPTQSANDTFMTLGAPDTTPPTITETVTPTSTQSVDIDFSTNEPATSVVDHGPTAGLGTSLPDTSFQTTHLRSIGGLTPGSTLFYDISATDPDGNTGATGVQAFVMPNDVAVTTTSLPDGKVDKTYSEFLTATGGVGTITWSLETGSLPPGLILVASTGEISGQPSDNGTYNFSVRATDAGTTPSTTVAMLSINVKKKGGGGGDDEGCTTGEGNGPWMLLAALLALTAFTWRRFGRA